MASSSWVVALEENEHEFWGKKCSLKELMDIGPSTLTIAVEVQINKITVNADPSVILPRRLAVGSNQEMMRRMESLNDEDGGSLVELTVNEDELKMLRTAEPGKELSGPIE